MVLKRITKLLDKRPSQDNVDTGGDDPESIVGRHVRLFCESGGANSGEEVLHLPTIVENAVASPAAAAGAATQIRKFLSKDGLAKPHVQYNAIMLVRILADNPGQSFTKNVDTKFVDTVKNLLRNGRDPSVQQILRETLDALDREKAYDTNLNNLFAMWRKEQGMGANAGYGYQNQQAWAPPAAGSGDASRSGARKKTLPAPTELASRIEEARTSAKLLLQLVQSTPPNEVLGNDLIKEFSDRCQAAQRSISGYIHADNPAPDDDTMLTLIETNEQLSLALSKHQRAVLQARRAAGSPAVSPPAVANTAPILPPVASTSPPPNNNVYNSNNTAPGFGSTLPSSLQAGNPRPQPQTQYNAPPPQIQYNAPAPAAAPTSATNAGPEAENPFSDPYDQPYAAPTVPPPQSRPAQQQPSVHAMYSSDAPVVSPNDERRVSALPGEYDAARRTPGHGDVSPILEQRAPAATSGAGSGSGGIYRY